MDVGRIRQQEEENDGQSVQLYYDDIAGMYLAFGLSAYYADMIANGHLSFSDELQMPVMLLDREGVLDLRQSMTILQHTPKGYYHFKTRQQIGNEGYERWTDALASRLKK